MFNLLEILIALVIIATTLLGIVRLQTLSLRQVHTAYYQNMAMVQAQALMERFRADSSAAGRTREFNSAMEILANLLPQGQSDYQCAGTPPQCTVTVFWQDHGKQTITLSSIL